MGFLGPGEVLCFLCVLSEGGQRCVVLCVKVKSVIMTKNQVHHLFKSLVFLESRVLVLFYTEIFPLIILTCCERGFHVALNLAFSEVLKSYQK